MATRGRFDPGDSCAKRMAIREAHGNTRSAWQYAKRMAIREAHGEHAYMLGFLIRASIVALGLWLATVWVNGVSIDTPATLILAGVLLGIVNSIVRPIAILLTLPMTIITLGLFLLVINAGMVALVAWMLPGMHVASFWSAFWTSVLVSLVSFVGSWFVGGKGKVEVIVRRR
jgi:putative membrane protein